MSTPAQQPDVVQTFDGGNGQQPLLVLDRIEAFLDTEGIGSGPLNWARIGEGQSNVTYRIGRGEADLVLRRGPRPPLPRSTHDMVRESRIQSLLRDEGFPVPNIVATCADESILGVPFYIMDFLEGAVITDSSPPHFVTPDAKRTTSKLTVDTLVQLHSLDISREPLSSLGRPDGYLKRQVDRFSSLWDVNTLRSLPQVAELGSWLEKNMPDTQRHSLIHGDYRMGNLMFTDAEDPAVLAVLDWEMATLGDPLADLGYLLATYAERGESPSVMELTSVTREPGYFSRAEIVNRYQDQMTLDLSALPWYQALALWKASIFCEAIYTRWLKGERPEDRSFSARLEKGVPDLLARAQSFAALMV
ncbi:phosphotransferase family protein [Paeniglutamicibacter sp.]|uniref:phosphotransferase family protein n=1 Tax=Paeniglutamicibacter sp. TaxID=1934391 RepID=UPI00398A1AC5